VAKSVLKIAVTVALLAAIVWRLGGVAGIIASLSRADVYLVLVLMAILTADRAVMTIKWLWLLKAQRMELPFMKGLHIYCVSSFWGQVLPMTLGADVVRVFMTTRSKQGVNTVVATIAIERMVGFIASLLMGVCGLVVLGGVVELDARFEQVWWIALGMIAAVTVAFSASFSQLLFDLFYRFVPGFLARTRVFARFKEMHRTYLEYRRHGGVLFNFTLLTAAEQLVPIIYIWTAAAALGIKLDFLVAVGIVPLATLITRIPVSVAGLGVLEGAFMVLMPLGGVSPVDAVSIALLDRVAQLAATLPWWLADALKKRRLEPPQPPLTEKPSS
jgi:glycosyltransferase 2 family protein